MFGLASKSVTTNTSYEKMKVRSLTSEMARLDADTTSKQQFESLTIYFGIESAVSKRTRALTSVYSQHLWA